MNILYLAHRIPFPPNKGDKLRSWRQLEHLARHYRVWCACFVDDPADQKYVEFLSAYCHQLAAIRLHRTPATLKGLGGLVRGRTITESFYYHPKMVQTLERWSQSVRFDAVVAFSSSMAGYALQVPAGRRVLDLCDLDSRKWLDYAEASAAPARRVYATEGNRLAARERDWLNEFDTTILITKAEAALLGDAVPANKIQIVGNGVALPELGTPPGEDLQSDTAASVTNVAQPPSTGNAPSDGEGESTQPHPGAGVLHANVAQPPSAAKDSMHLSPYNTGAGSSSPTGPVVGFAGTMDYRPNVDAVCWFVENCWERIRASFPQCIFRIVGRSPTRRVRQLAHTPGVEIVGEVNNMPTEVQRFVVSVAPMQIARGLQNKVLEAMAAARPVVLSNKASEGIGGGHNQEYLIADEPQDMVEAVVRLLEDQSERKRIGTAARRYVACHHCWDFELQRFELIVVGQIGPVSKPVEEAMPAQTSKTAGAANSPYEEIQA